MRILLLATLTRMALHIIPLTIQILHPNLRVGIPIELLRAEHIQIDGERPRNQEARQRHRHGDLSASPVGNGTEDRREDCAAADRRDEEAGAAFCVSPEAAEREGEDGGEDAGFEEEDEAQTRDAGVAFGAHGGADEDDDHGHEEQEDPAGFHDFHARARDEAADGEETLRDGQLVGPRCRSGPGADVHDVVDEIACDGDLGADVAELSCDAPEQRILLAERLVDVAG